MGSFAGRPAEYPAPMGTAGILGLDIGGANLKAATPNPGGRAASVPFPLWKQPDRLPAALAELVAQFENVEEFDVREDRRQSAYGLSILNALIVKAAKRAGSVYFSAINPTSNKPIGSKRAKVRQRVKARRTLANTVRARYNTIRRENGYNIAA